MDTPPDDPAVIPFPVPPKEQRGGREPFINLPPVTKWFALLLLAIHLGLKTVSYERLYWIYQHFGFVAATYSGHQPFTWMAAVAPFTYMLLHGSWAHVLLNVVTLTAFGAGVERWLGGRRMMIFFILCGLASVAVQFALNPSSPDPVIGASGGLSGLFAAILVMVQRSGAVPRGRYGLWPLIILWVVVSALFGLTGGPGGENIAWIAHIGGFVAGFLFLHLVAPRRET